MSKAAFPLKEAGVNESLTGIVDNEGMSMLEYYAGQALTGVISNNAFYLSAIETAQEQDTEYTEWISIACFEFAEAMVKEAEKRSK